MSVALLCRSPGQVIVEVSAALTVHTCCVMLAVTLRIHLQRDTEKKAHVELSHRHHRSVHH